MAVICLSNTDENFLMSCSDVAASDWIAGVFVFVLVALIR